jgi:hypothetical protein
MTKLREGKPPVEFLIYNFTIGEEASIVTTYSTYESMHVGYGYVRKNDLLTLLLYKNRFIKLVHSFSACFTL